MWRSHMLLIFFAWLLACVPFVEELVRRSASEKCIEGLQAAEGPGARHAAPCCAMRCRRHRAAVVCLTLPGQAPIADAVADFIFFFMATFRCSRAVVGQGKQAGATNERDRWAGCMGRLRAEQAAAGRGELSGDNNQASRLHCQGTAPLGACGVSRRQPTALRAGAAVLHGLPRRDQCGSQGARCLPVRALRMPG